MICNRFHKPVLLVEDDPLLAATMRRCLERLSDDVRVAETCAEAIAAWTALAGEGIVLMDYRLPDGTGTEVIARMRAAGRRDPVICMTAESERITPEVSDQLEIQMILGKPVMLDALREALATFAVPVAYPVGASPVRRPRRAGKFRHLVWQGRLTGQRVARLCRAAKDETWVALDVAGMTGVGEDAAWRGLCAWSGWLSSAGGRLCVVATDPVCRALVEKAAGAYLDVVSGVDALVAQSARLTGAAERRQLLGLIRKPEVRKEALHAE